MAQLGLRHGGITQASGKGSGGPVALVTCLVAVTKYLKKSWFKEELFDLACRCVGTIPTTAAGARRCRVMDACAQLAFSLFPY